MIQAWLLRQLPWLAVTLVVISSGWALGAWLKEKGRDEMRPQIEKLQAELDTERAARIRNEEATNAYLSELESIRNRPRPSTPVRLCVPAPSPEPTTSATDGAATAAGGDAGAVGGDLVAGPDIGPELRALAYACDAENAKLRALQGWVRGLE